MILWTGINSKAFFCVYLWLQIGLVLTHSTFSNQFLARRAKYMVLYFSKKKIIEPIVFTGDLS